MSPTASYVANYPIMESMKIFKTTAYQIDHNQLYLMGPPANCTQFYQGFVFTLLLYINDITKPIKSTIRFYADDTLMYRVINSMDDCLSLQNDLNSLVNWSNLWQIKFNTGK